MNNWIASLVTGAILLVCLSFGFLLWALVLVGLVAWAGLIWWVGLLLFFVPLAFVIIGMML